MAGTEKPSKLRKWALRLAKVSGPPLFLWVLLYTAGAVRLSASLAALEQELGPIDVDAAPPQRGQETAQATAIQRLAAQSGLHLSLQVQPERFAHGHVPHINDWRRYVSHRLTGSAIVPDDQDRVESWLFAHGGELDQLARLITEESPGLCFQHHPRANRGNGVPHFKGPYTVATLLVSRALTRIDEGDHLGAERLLAAAWQLTEALTFPAGHLRRRYRSGVQLKIALALRRLPGASAEWETRLAESAPVDELARRHPDLVADVFDAAYMHSSGGPGSRWPGHGGMPTGSSGMPCRPSGCGRSPTSWSSFTRSVSWWRRT